MNYITCSYNKITILLFRNIRLYKIRFRVKVVVLLKNDRFNPKKDFAFIFQLVCRLLSANMDSDK